MWRMLIADDEEIECRGLEMMIQNNFKTIELLPSVYNGVTLIKSVERFQPDLIIVDINMPGLNGLEAIEVLRMKAMNTKVIINTAYSDFAYIKKALLLGTVDYLVKPADEEQLVEAVSRVIEKIEQERKQSQENKLTEKRFQDMQKIVGNELMYSILLGNPNEEGLRIWLDNLGRTYLGGVLAAVRLNDKVKQGVYLEKIQRLAEEQLKRFCTSLTAVYKDVLYLFLLPGGMVGEDNYQPWAKQLLEMLQEKIKAELSGEAVFGVSRWKYEFEKMPEALKECRAAFNHPADGGIHFFEAESSRRVQNIYEEEKTEEIADAIKEGDWEKGKRLLRQKVSDWKEAGLGLWQEQQLMVDFVRKCTEQLSGQKGRNFSWRQLLGQLKAAVGEEELIAEAMRILQDTTGDNEVSDMPNTYVEEAVLYIEKNYMNDISLDMLAERLGISSFYLSRLLTQQLDESFIELLTDTRIDHAIELIRREDFIVKDIGSRVGYLSPTYFYKVFKKNTGLTVGEMRRLLKGE